MAWELRHACPDLLGTQGAGWQGRLRGKELGTGVVQDDLQQLTVPF